MRQDDIKDLPNLDDYSYENIFSVYQQEDGMYYYNLLNTVNFPNDILPTLYNEIIVEENLTWPILSFKLYGTIKLWWTICAVNNILNPLDIPKPGTKLKVLTTDAMREVLKQINING